MSALGRGYQFRNSGAVAIRGRLANYDQGASGAVFLKVLPTSAELRRYRTRQSVPEVYAAYQVVENGEFELRFNPSSLPAGYVAPDGQIDVELTASDGQQDAVWFTSLQSPADGAGSFAALAGQFSRVPKVPDVTVDFGRSTVDDGTRPMAGALDQTRQGASDIADPAIDSAHGLKIALAPHGRAFAVAERNLVDTTQAASDLLEAANFASPRETCVTGWDSGTQISDEYWADIHSKNGPWKVTVTAGNKQTLGIEYEGGQSGTASIDSAMKSTMNAAEAAAFNQVAYREWFNTCYPADWMRPHHTVTILSHFMRIAPYDYRNCFRVSQGVSYEKSQTRNVTVKGGVNIKKTGLTAESGWNDQVQMELTPEHNGYICGDDPDGWLQSRGVSAK